MHEQHFCFALVAIDFESTKTSCMIEDRGHELHLWDQIGCLCGVNGKDRVVHEGHVHISSGRNFCLIEQVGSGLRVSNPRNLQLMLNLFTDLANDQIEDQVEGNVTNWISGSCASGCENRVRNGRRAKVCAMEHVLKEPIAEVANCIVLLQLGSIFVPFGWLDIVALEGQDEHPVILRTIEKAGPKYSVES